MEENKRVLPIAPFGKILKRNGAVRISQRAAESFRDLIEEYVNEVAKKIVEIQKLTNRNTVKQRDVDAVKKFL